MTVCATVVSVFENLSRPSISLDRDYLDAHWRSLMTFTATDQFREVDLFDLVGIFPISSRIARLLAQRMSPPRQRLYPTLSDVGT